MSSHDFYFALEFSSQGIPATLVEDLAAHVFQYVHCADTAITGLTDAIEKAVAHTASGHGRCDLQFRAQNGTLEILVLSNGGRIWQTKLPIS